MPPLPGPPSTTWNPRVIAYYQTYHSNGVYTSLLPLLTHPSGMTHLILGAIHINSDPNGLTLNDTSPYDDIFTQLWDEVLVLQDSGIKVMGMLGGAAKGSYARLDMSESRTDVPVIRFEAYYLPLRDLIRRYNLDGLDLDVEEECSLPGIVHLIDRLRSDFGPEFIVTLAPVATALMPSRPHLSGFDYRLLEAARGAKIDWYNVQFYNGWGWMLSSTPYDEIIRAGWKPEKVVVGTLTNPKHGGSGFLSFYVIAPVLALLVEKYPRFGGVSGWEYWNALPDEDNPWKWSVCMALCMGMKKVRDAAVVVAMGRSLAGINVQRR